MSEKRKARKLPKRDPKAIEVQSKKPDCQLEKEKLLAQTYLRPTVMAAATIKGHYSNNDEVNINALINELSAQVALVKEGNMGRPEAMLISQAHTLDALFAELINRSRMNMGEYFNAACKYMQMAFKAQSQCRTTLEALAEIKNPRSVAFIRQQNVGENVQVNNNPTSENEFLDQYAHAHAGENHKSTNGLLEDKRHETEWLDTRSPETASGDDKELEAVGAQHRAKDE